MASLSQVSLIILLFCISLSSLPSFTSSKSQLVHEKCTRVNKQYPSLKVQRCVTLLSANSRALNVTKIKALTLISLRLAEKSAKKMFASINGKLGSGKLKTKLKPIILEVAKQVKLVYLTFRSAYLEVKEEEEYTSANYDCSLVSDYIKIAVDQVKKINGKTDLFYKKSLDLLNQYAQINIVLTNDADTGGGGGGEI